ncbi:MAG: DEAD/DEAH box helicase [Acidobacteriota bacterium]
MLFTKLGLDPQIVRAVRDEGYETPTPIQAKAIPAIIEGRDLIGCAQTGTGKTAAFALPLLNRLRAGARGRLRALILTPTRELAQQVAEFVKVYGRHLHLRSAVIYGGVGYGPQESALRRGVDILVATPGRLLDHMGRGNVNFKNLEVLILDEADRMLDMGFIRDLRRIIKAIPARRQTLLFSATMPDEIRRLSKEILCDPISVEVAPRRAAPAQGVRQALLPVTTARKRDLLAHLVENEAKGQTLVFTRTKHGANKLARHLERRGHGVAVLHGNRSQAQRTRALDAFKKKRARLMVATDIAGRGIDVDGITHVVNYDLPQVPEDYVHRIGRTARAGATGDALSLVCPEDRKLVRAIESLIGCSIERRSVLDFAVGADAPPRSPAGNGRRFQKRSGSGQGGQRPAKRRSFGTRSKQNTGSGKVLPSPKVVSGWRGRASRRRAV